MFNIIKQALRGKMAVQSATAGAVNTKPVANPLAKSAINTTEKTKDNTKNKTIKGRAARTSGYAAEDAAAAWLAQQGLRIVARNVRYAFGELDIVAWDGDTLVLFEVRLRKNSRFGSAADSITPRKQARLMAAAEAYSAGLKPAPPLRIDVISYDGDAQTTQPQWIRNALG